MGPSHSDDGPAFFRVARLETFFLADFFAVMRLAATGAGFRENLRRPPRRGAAARVASRVSASSRVTLSGAVPLGIEALVTPSLT